MIRWHEIYSSRIGHFSKEIEILYCEQKLGINVPSQKHLNLFFFHRFISNRQLAKMWKRKLNFLDAGTGALGQGLSIAIGYFLGFSIRNLNRKVNVRCG